MQTLEFKVLSDTYANDLQCLWADKDVIKYTHILKPLTIEETHARILQFETSDVFVVLKEGEFLGVVGCAKMDETGANFALFYQTKKTVWNRGYTTIAANWMVEYMIKRHTDFAILADVIKANVASAKILLNLGFELISQKDCLHKGLEVQVQYFKRQIRGS